jgi:hypothetical protein
MMRKPQCCTTCAKHNDRLLNCSRCRGAYYCDVTCQKSDYSVHKQWCQAAAAAKTCTRCTAVALAHPELVIVHADNLLVKSTIDCPADQRLFVFHYPFTGKVARQLNDKCQANPRAYDTILILDQQIICGIWEIDFTDAKLRLIRDKRNEDCIVCYEKPETSSEGCQRIGCFRCKNPVCVHCITKMGSPCSDGYSYTCPVCRALMLYCKSHHDFV